MPDLEFEGFESQTSNFSLLAAIVAISLVVGFTLVILIIGATRNSALATATRNIEQRQNQIRSLGDLERQAKALSSAALSFDRALEQTVDWKAFWNEIVATQLKDVSYANFSIDTTKLVRVDGRAANFVAVAKQVKSIDGSPAFSQVSLVSTVREGDKIKFALSFSFDSNKFKLAK